MLNTHHKNYSKFKEELERIIVEGKAAEEEFESSSIKGLDGPLTKIHKETAHKITVLKKKYSYLYN